MMRRDSVATWLRWQESLNVKPIEMGLSRVKDVLSRLELPIPVGRVVTVGGTNGKGSTITLLRDVLLAAGRFPGTYTSPHLVHYNERICIGGRPIADAALIQAFERVEAARRAVPLTYFEFGTLAALVGFADAGCDTWLLEVGLGGRLDAVNILDADVALVTTVGLDHQAWLGDTLEAIAKEKAGIFKPGRLALYGDQPVPDAIRAQALDVGAGLQVYGEDFFWSVEPGDAKSWSWSWRRSPTVAHIGSLNAPSHWTAAQYRNATLALAAVVQTDGQTAALKAAVLNPVLLSSRPPGRFEIVRREHEWILDVAHNPQAAAVLCAQLRTLPLPAGGNDAVTMVVAVLADKAFTAFLTELRAAGGRWIAAGIDDPRASSEAEMRAAMAAAELPDADWADTPEAAFELARRLTPPGGRIVVCGSFRIVAPARMWLGLY